MDLLLPIASINLLELVVFAFLDQAVDFLLQIAALLLSKLPRLLEHIFLVALLKLALELGGALLVVRPGDPGVLFLVEDEAFFLELFDALCILLQRPFVLLLTDLLVLAIDVGAHLVERLDRLGTVHPSALEPDLARLAALIVLAIVDDEIVPGARIVEWMVPLVLIDEGLDLFPIHPSVVVPDLTLLAALVADAVMFKQRVAGFWIDQAGTGGLRTALLRLRLGRLGELPIEIWQRHADVAQDGDEERTKDRGERGPQPLQHRLQGTLTAQPAPDRAAGLLPAAVVGEKRSGLGQEKSGHSAGDKHDHTGRWPGAPLHAQGQGRAEKRQSRNEAADRHHGSSDEAE